MSTVFGNNMRLFTTYWGNDKTFKLMPVTQECPYVEAIYDTNTDLLVVISKNKKMNLQMVPKLDDNGNQVPSKAKKNNGNPVKEKQIQMEVLQEHYLIEREEQEEFIKSFATNAKDFDYAKFFKDMDAQPAIHIPETAPLVDDKGMPLVAK